MDSFIKKLLQKIGSQSLVIDEVQAKPKFNQIHHVDDNALKLFFESYVPIFFLNTGRSGSAFLDRVFSNIKTVRPYHEATPNLMMFPNYAFHNQSEKIILQRIFEAARIELMLEAFIHDKTYVETNHCLTFFSYQIKSVFPRVKFVHLLRHPGDFIRSALMKGWHRNNSIWENNRIRMSENESWDHLSQVEKLAWVWNSTHSFIERFKASYPESVFTIKFEDIVSRKESLQELITFLDRNLHLEDRIIEKLQSEKVNEILIHKSEPPNMFKLAEYPKYQDWTLHQKEIVKKFAGKLSEEYSYPL